MSDLRNKYRAREADLREDLQALEVKIRCQLEQLQLKADPLEMLGRINGQALASLGLEAANLLVSWQAKTDELANLQRVLGR